MPDQKAETFKRNQEALQILRDTKGQVTPEATDVYEQRVEEGLKKLDLQHKWLIDIEEGNVPAKRGTSQFKRQAKAFNNIFATDVTNQGPLLSHDAWRKLTTPFQDLPEFSKLAQSHHKLAQANVAQVYKGRPWGEWWEANNRLQDTFTARGLNIKGGNVVDNAAPIFQPWHQGGIHGFDRAFDLKRFRPGSPLAIGELADQLEQINSVTNSYFPDKKGRILFGQDQFDFGSSQNAVATQALTQNPELMKQLGPDTMLDLLKNASSPSALKKLAKQWGLNPKQLLDVNNSNMLGLGAGLSVSGLGMLKQAAGATGLGLLQDAVSDKDIIQGAVQGDPEKIGKGALNIGKNAVTGQALSTVIGKTSAGKYLAPFTGLAGWAGALTTGAYMLTDEIYKQQFGKGLKEKSLPTAAEKLAINADMQRMQRDNPAMQSYTNTSGMSLPQKTLSILKDATAPISPWW